MTYLWTVLAFVVFGGVGWYIGRDKGPAMRIIRVLLLLAAVVTMLMTEGPAQQVVAAGLVGWLLGELAAEVTERRRSAPQPGTD